MESVSYQPVVVCRFAIRHFCLEVLRKRQVQLKKKKQQQKSKEQNQKKKKREEKKKHSPPKQARIEGFTLQLWFEKAPEIGSPFEELN